MFHFLDNLFTYLSFKLCPKIKRFRFVHGDRVYVWYFLQTEHLAYFQTKMRFLLERNASKKKRSNGHAKKVR